ncbi:MAG: polysaccharide deacetylase family protein [Acidobacteriota bacterium]
MSLYSTLASLPPVRAFFEWRLAARRLPGVAVLGYHGVRRDDTPRGRMAFEGLHVPRALFEAHCRVLSEVCHPISLETWRRAAAGEGDLPARPVLVTFDDGYRSVVTEALPVLERFRVPAVVHVCTAPVETRRRFWYDAMALSLGESAVTAIKRRPHHEWLQAIAAIDRAVAEDDPHCPMSIDDVARLGAHELIEIGGHSATHPILARADRAVQQREIWDCVSALGQWTGRPVRAFAYPNGRPLQDFTLETVALVAAAGIDRAFTTAPGFAGPDADPMALPRFVMTDGVTPAHLASRLGSTWW